MLPVHLAENIRKQVLFYLQSTFDFRDKRVEKTFERFLTDPEFGLFKGPWVQLRRPYRPADAGENVPFDFPVEFRPFKHQNRSWRRLSSNSQQPKPTIVTTGTGSGKTECFLFPILDHCLRARRDGQKGIKAIILYPMNALAADQEKRFARVIWKTQTLRDAGIRVGNYRKGALRRVVASEHTGLLATEEWEKLELDSSRTEHTDDPNVLTCTSKLERGIDIGDLSSTMLCSIPPSTASYLQRIGRAGRATGTALIVSVVNQRPHDLFFYGRPSEMLRGKVDPPGCWLDASAVLVRQYLAYGFDSATKVGELVKLPKSGKQLVEDMAKPDGHVPKTMQWITKNEADLRGQFLKRFHDNVQQDTRERFIVETNSDLLIQRIHLATGEFERMVRDLENARKRLRDQLSKLNEEEKDARLEIEQELRILQGRLQSLSRTTALEILTDNGLLPNYAFPERGVRFYGAIYNKHRRSDQEQKPIEITRPAGVALKELAPANHFYTHSRCFDVQQIALGNQQQPLVEEWAICGACGHMRPVEDLNKSDAKPACPQCGHDRDVCASRK